MRPTARRSRNSRGEFAREVEDRVATLEGQVAANADEQRQVVSQVTSRTDFGALVTLKRWKIAITPDRAQVCLWAFIMVVKFLSILSIVSFWLCSIMCTKTLPTWDGPVQLFNGYRRRNGAAQNIAIGVGDTWWRDLFPLRQTVAAYTLKIRLYESGFIQAPIIYSYSMPILLSNPLVWMSLMAFTFSSYHFLSFIQGCLQQAKLAAKVFARRRSS